MFRVCAFSLAGLGLLAFFLGGCSHASYATPAPSADLAMWQEPQTKKSGPTKQQFLRGEDSVIHTALDRKPMAKFPASIAIARIQAPGYRSHTAAGYGSGKFSVVIQRDVESESHYKTLATMTGVRALAPIPRLLLPPRLDSDQTLRRGAATMRSDMLLIYTLDTRFHRVGTTRPLTVVTIGILDNYKIEVLTTASAVLLDTRTGFVYGVAEGSAKQQGGLNNWSNDEVIDQLRREVETKAFDELVKGLTGTWAGIAQEFGKAAAAETPIGHRLASQ